MAIGNFSPLLSNRIKPKNPKGLDEVRVISVRERKTDKHDNPSEAFPKHLKKFFLPIFLQFSKMSYLCTRYAVPIGSIGNRV